MDEGTLQNHEDLQQKIVGGDGFAGEHGTWVAGVAGAATNNNSVGIASLGWNLSLNTYGEGGWETSALVNKITEAYGASEIINMSFGTLDYATLEDVQEARPDCPRPDKWVGAWIPRSFPEIATAVYNAIVSGAICVAAAGNTTKNSANFGPLPGLCDPMVIPFESFPAQYENVIAVSGTQLASGVEIFVDRWNYGGFIDLAAPGDTIFTTDVGGGYSAPNGTSFSAPLVSALVGLVLSVNPSLTREQVTNILISSTDQVDQDRFPYVNGWNSHLGYGRINAYKALKYTLEHYGGTLSQSLTIPSGETWTFSPGVTLKFATGTSLTSYGNIQAVGTGSLPWQRITFTSTSPGSTWSGIAISGSGANNSTMRYCYVDKVQTYGGSAIYVNGASGFDLKNSNISNNVNYSTTGVGLFNAGNPNIGYNTISSNGNWGVTFWSTNGYLYRNNIQNNPSGGVNCGYYASPMFGAAGFLAYNGNNLITGGSWGIRGDYFSYPYVGTSAPVSYVGWNSIYGNTSGRVAAYYGSQIAAANNWWGSVTPSSSWFLNSGGTVTWQPYLTYDPRNQASVKDMPIPQASMMSTSRVDPREIGLVDAIEARVSRDFEKALSILTELFEKTDDENSIAMLAAEAINLYREVQFPGLLAKIMSKSTGLDQSPALRLAIAKMHMIDQDPSEGLEGLRLVAEAFPSTEHAKRAMLDLFFYYNARPSEYSEEENLIAKLHQLYPADDVVKQARWLYSIKNPSKLSFGEEDFETTARRVGDAFDIMSFPNPFNPSTTIRFVLPDQGHVKLRVYDLLGRVVAELLDENMIAGQHQKIFDALRLPSGVYFYKLDFNGESISKKFVLTK